MPISASLQAFLDQVRSATTEGVSNLLSDVVLFKAAIEELAAGAIEVQDEGATEVAVASILDFRGAGVVVTDQGSGNARVTISGGAGGALDFEEEGAAVVTATVLNAVGGGATITDVGGVATLTVPLPTIDFQEEGGAVVSAVTFNAVGIGHTLSDVGGVATLTNPGIAYQEEGAGVVSAVILNFVGSAVTVTDVAGVATVTITGGLTAWEEEGGAIVSSSTANFVGAGATVTDVGGVATITIPGELPVFMAEHETATTVNGGTSFAAAFGVRPLTDVRKNTITGASLLANQITLPAGSYRVTAWQEVFRVLGCQSALWNDTDSAFEVVGMAALADTGTDGDPLTLELRGYFTLAAEKVLEFQVFTNTVNATSGIGAAGSSGQVEIFANIMIEKLD